MKLFLKKVGENILFGLMIVIALAGIGLFVVKSIFNSPHPFGG